MPSPAERLRVQQRFRHRGAERAGRRFGGVGCLAGLTVGCFFAGQGSGFVAFAAVAAAAATTTARRRRSPVLAFAALFAIGAGFIVALFAIAGVIAFGGILVTDLVAAQFAGVALALATLALTAATTAAAAALARLLVAIALGRGSIGFGFGVALDASSITSSSSSS